MKPLLATELDRLPAGVLHASLPTPFPVGPVNCWLLPERPVTLVDPGMYSADSLAMVDDLLATARLSVKDVDQIVVTHSHPDHYGAAGWIAAEADAPIIAGRDEIPKLLGEHSDTIVRQYFAMLDDMGVPDDVRAAMPVAAEMVGALIRIPLPEQITPVDDLETLDAGGRAWELHVTPGHALGHVSLWNEPERVLFSGDHLLARITPNPLLEPDSEAESGRRRSLIDYLGSLDRFVRLAPSAVLPGHDVAFRDVGKLITNLRLHHAERAAEIAQRIADGGSMTVYELAMAMFPHLEGMGVVLGISEVVGHLDLLLADGVVREVEGPPLRFTPL